MGCEQGGIVGCRAAASADAPDDRPPTLVSVGASPPRRLTGRRLFDNRRGEASRGGTQTDHMPFYLQISPRLLSGWVHRGAIAEIPGSAPRPLADSPISPLRMEWLRLHRTLHVRLHRPGCARGAGGGRADAVVGSDHDREAVREVKRLVPVDSAAKAGRTARADSATCSCNFQSKAVAGGTGGVIARP